jgi:hypothetical protein
MARENGSWSLAWKADTNSRREQSVGHSMWNHSHSNIRNATGVPTPTTAKPMPHILYHSSTQSNNQIVHIPRLGIIPSGFGYGLSVPLPVDPHCGKGILGPPPGNLSPSDIGIQQLQQRPLLSTPNQQTVRNLRPAWSGCSRTIEIGSCLG